MLQQTIKTVMLAINCILYFLNKYLMALMEKFLVVKKSTIPGAGKGLFTEKFIPKGKKITEYKGKVSTWKEVNHNDGLNAYIYYVNRNHVIDGAINTSNLARYINDAKGCETKIRPKNNCIFVNEELRVYIEAKRDIEAGSELFVGYGKEYWDTLRLNRGLVKKTKRKPFKKKR